MTLETMQPFEQSFTVSQQEHHMPNSAAIPVGEPDNYLLETFHQLPHGDFRPTFYNPFEIKHRRRTSRAQLKTLEKSFSENTKPSATVRRILARKLEMTPRGVQIWFQNRRAKAKLLRKKSGLQQQRVATKKHRKLDLSSSDENEDIEEEEYKESYHSDSSRSVNQSPAIAKEYPASSIGDLSHSSILFSQFLTNVNTNDQALIMDENTTFTSLMQSATGNNSPVQIIHPQQYMIESDMDLRLWKHHDSIRTVVATAAAAAFATSNTPSTDHYDINILSIPQNWITHSDALDMLYNQNQFRRRSCPISRRTTAAIPDVRFNNYRSHSSTYDSTAWSNPSMVSQNKEHQEATKTSSPVMPLYNNMKRHLSYDSSTHSSVDYYPMQDLHINYPSQLTPPLTASCSASTVAGSPITLDNLYSGPVTVSQQDYNGYYAHHSNNSSHTSSPLSTTTLVNDMTKFA